VIRIGYAPRAFDLFHIGHRNLLRRAKGRSDDLIAGVVADDVVTRHKGVAPLVPLSTSSSALRRVLQNTELLIHPIPATAGACGLIAPEREELGMNNIREGMSPPETSVGALGISTWRQGSEGSRAGGPQSRRSRS
jgi:cytidyltransferase-like protein